MNCVAPHVVPPRRGALISARGVVLLEVLVAILIFSFGILGTVGLLARATQYSVNAEDRNRAALLANELVSSMWAARNVNVDRASWEAQVVAGLPNGGNTVVVDVVNGTADITVTWRSPSARAGDPGNSYATQVAIPPVTIP